MKFESYSFDDTEFDLLLDDLSSDIQDYTSYDETSSQSTIVATTMQKKKSGAQSSSSKYQSKKRKIDVVVDNGEVVSFEADFPRPRIVKTDIRRSYANMYTNAMNSGDFRLLFGFFDTFCNSTFSHSITRTIPMMNESKVFSFFRRGIAETVMHWYYTFLTVPDSALFITNTDILTNDDGSSRIVSRYRFKATRIYDCSALWKQIMDGSTTGDEFFQLKPVENDSNIMDVIQKTVHDRVSSLKLMIEPMPAESEGVFTLFLDEDKRITKMEMNSISLASFTRLCNQ